MANEVLIDGGPGQAKVRSPWLVLLFGVITLGIYTWFWWYYVNRDLARLGAERGTTRLGTSPGTSTAAFTIGGLVWIPWIWTIITTHKRLREAQRITGAPDRLNPGVATMLWIFTFGIGGMVYMQSELNKVWHSPGMRPVEGTGPAAGDSERAEKLRELLDVGALMEPEYAAQRERLRLP